MKRVKSTLQTGFVCIAALVGVLLSIVGSPMMKAQTATAAIVGVCTDPSGARVPNASVTATNVGTNEHFSATTDSSGTYTLPSLPIGQYSLAVSASGFNSIQRSGIILHVGDRAAINFLLKVGSSQQKITVSSAAPLVQTASSGLSQLLTNQYVTALPVNGRNALALTVLMPGVRNLQGGNDLGFGRSQGDQLANIGINGSTGGFTQFLLDGATDTSPGWGDVSVGPLAASVQEVNVFTGYLPPQYGFTEGGVVSAVTKTGTNSFHGSIYEFLRNNDFDARNAFSPTRTPLRYNQFGVAVGGPVLIPKIYNGRNRTFFFFNYEGSRRSEVSNPITTVPTQAERAGDFSQLESARGLPIPIYDPATTIQNANGSGYLRSAFPGNRIPTSRFDKVAQNVLAFIPLSNQVPNNQFAQTNNFISSQPLTTNVNQYMARVDHSFGYKNRLFGRWSYNDELSNRPDDAGPWSNPILYERHDDIKNQQALLSDVNTFSPNLLNEARVSIMRQYFPFVQGSFGQGWPQKLGLPSSVPSTLFPLFSIAGMANFGGVGTTGIRAETSWQFFDLVSQIHGNHSLNYGVDVRLYSYANFQASEPSGNYAFPSTLTGNPQSPAGSGSGFATFLLGDVGSGNLDVQPFPTYVGHSYSFFVGDDWKVNRRLTLNLGLRYDFQSPPVERRCRSSNFNPSVPNPTDLSLMGSFQFACVDYGRTVVQPDRSNFGPRIGFAYDVTGDSRTALRGGFGIVYGPTFTVNNFPPSLGFSYVNNWLPPGNNTNFPAFQLENGPPFVQQPGGASLGPNAFLGSSVDIEQSTMKIPYTQQWNLSLQHQFRQNWLIEADYVGNRGVHLPAHSYQWNALDPEYFSLGLQLQNLVPNPLAGLVPGSLGGPTVALSQTLLPFPQYSSVSIYNPFQGSSTYNALQVKFQHRFGHGFTLLGNYTAAKLIDSPVTSNISWLSSLASTLGGYQNGKFNRRADRSLDPTDIAKAFVVSYVWQLPIGSGKALSIHNRFANYVLGNWSISGDFTAQGGTPLEITGANNFLATRPDSTGQSAKLANPSRNQWLNPSVFVNPPIYQFGNLSRTLPNVRGPGLVDLDFGLMKSFHLTEKISAQLRGEAFNLLNNTNLGLPNTDFVPGPDGLNANGSFGAITSAYDPRELQFALKVLW